VAASSMRLNRAAQASQPRLDVEDLDPNVGPYPLLGHGPAVDPRRQQITRRDLYLALRASWLGAGPSVRSKTSSPTGTRSGCATDVPRPSGPGLRSFGLAP
jgi:hypothetical protein